MAGKSPEIKSFVKVAPMIYAYNTPGVSYHEGWTKIGYTEQGVHKRIKQQTHTADIQYTLAWMDNAMYKDGSGEYFTDHDFHSYLEIERQVKRQPSTEWFEIDGTVSREYFYTFASRGLLDQKEKRSEYILREEQEAAVRMTKDYFDAGGQEFLWNAKPRFGKTLTTYDLVRKMGCVNVLIVTNRPSIANSWAEDFMKFIDWREEYYFVSETDSLVGKPGVISREEYSKRIAAGQERGMIAFVSLQDMKGSVYFGGGHDKLAWMSDAKDSKGNRRGLEFDLLVVDESQEGVDTLRTERAFNHIMRKHTLFLSGTPFKALAGGKFSSSQIYNWSYADEQERKDNWNSDDHNPYETLPRLSMYTYQLSGMIQDRIEQGPDLSEEHAFDDYAFDLNEFFLTGENGRFVHEAEVKKFLHALVTQEKYPFSTPQLRKELSHTIWILNRIASVEALEKLLKADDVFKDYFIVKAVGDGSTNDDEDYGDKEAKKNFDKVKAAISSHE